MPNSIFTILQRNLNFTLIVLFLGLIKNEYILKNLLETTLQTRKILYKILENTPKEHLLKIPDGFRNSIWWNIAHVMVTQQLLVYKMSNVEMRVPQELVDKFKKGTVPDGTATDDEIQMVSAFLFSTIEWTQQDYENGIFQEFKEYNTSANVLLKNVEDAMVFNLFHEGIHLGVILSLQKALMK